jgi:TolB-like protein
MVLTLSRLVRLAGLTCFLSLLAACASGGGSSGTLPSAPRPLTVFVQPFANLTTTPDAGRSVTTLLTAQLLRRQELRLASPESLPFPLPPNVSATNMSLTLRDRLKAAGLDAILSGSVIEYTYRSELESEPVVGINWTMTDLRTGRVLWSAALSGVGSCFLGCNQTLTSLSTDLIGKEVARFVGH